MQFAIPISWIVEYIILRGKYCSMQIRIDNYEIRFIYVFLP